MKFLSTPAVMALLTSSAAAHSWLHCVDTRVENKEDCEKHPSQTLVQTCEGHPRNQTHYDDWIWESSYYAYNLNTEFACKENQRKLGSTATGAPMATATPGQKLTLKWWGNGHSKNDTVLASPKGRDPGYVRLFSTGKAGEPIELAKDLNKKYFVPGTQKGFADDAVIEITDLNGTPHMNEKANYMEWTVSNNFENGLQAFVWCWAWTPSIVDGGVVDPEVYNDGWENSWCTCFDVEITGSSHEGPNPDICANQDNCDDGTEAELEKFCDAPCHKGGMAAYETDGNVGPPCRNRDATNNLVSCYDYDYSGKCPAFAKTDCGKLKKRDLVSRHRARKHRRRL